MEIIMHSTNEQIKPPIKVKTEEEIRMEKKHQLMNLIMELSGEINRLDDTLDKIRTIVYNL
jgi:hypothetical protein